MTDNLQLPVPVRPQDFVYLLETERQTWIAMIARDENGVETQFRLAFSSLDKAKEFAAIHRDLGARRVREVRLEDIALPGEPPIALDTDPHNLGQQQNVS